MNPARRFFPILAAAALVILFHQVSSLFAALAGTADVLLIWAAVGLVHRRALRALGGAHYAAGAVALLAAAMFLSDAGAMASAVGGKEISSYRIVVLRILLLLLVGGAAALIVARQLSALARAPSPLTPDSSSL